ncbi:MAG: hypothetical protein Q7T74_05465, partial [Candidatus Saccharibacteria bacterium]|nr:hypothetical protein [Candidatus Saccharibacteria bacterium]
GSSTVSAAFAVTNVAAGTPVATLSASTNSNGLSLDAANARIQSLRNNSLTIGGNTTGDIYLSGRNAAGNGVILSGYGTGILHSDSIGRLTSSAVNLASGDVTGTLPVGNGGTGLTTYNPGDVVYGNGSNTLSTLPIGAQGAVLSVVGGLPSWVETSVINFWQRAEGAIAPLYLTDDFLLGGSATSSASFGIINIANGNPIATFSATTNNNGIVINTANSSLQSLRNNPLTLGGTTTGDVIISGRNGSNTGVILSGYGAGAIQSDATGRLTSGTLPVSYGGTGATTFGGTNTLLYTTTADTLASLATANNATLITNATGVPSWTTAGNNQVLRSDGSGVISYGSIDLSQLNTVGASILSTTNGGTGLDTDSATNGQLLIGDGSGFTLSTLTQGSGITITNSAGGITITSNQGNIDAFWNQSNGLIYPNNSTVDFAIGGNATTSAQFAITGIANGAPTATLSATTNNNGLVLDAANSTIQSLLNNTLTIGGSTTGIITLSPLNGQGGSALNANSETVNLNGTTILNGTSLTSINGGATAINFTEFDVAAGTGSITIDDDGNLGSLSIDGTVLDIDSLAFVGAGTISSGGANSLTFDSGNNTIVFSASDTTVTATGLTTITSAATLGVSATTFNLGAGSAASIGTESDDNLTLSPNGTGNLILAGDFNSSVFVGNATTPAPLSISGGIGGNATLIVNQTNNGDVLSASSSGTTVFTLQNDGDILFYGSQATPITLTSAATTARSVTFGDESGTICLQNSLSCGYALGTNYWQLNSNLVSPINGTYDFAVGGTATTSAKFAVLNIAAGTPVATISANSGDNASYFTGDGILGTTNAQTLSIGSTSTGNIVLDSGSGVVQLSDNSLAFTGSAPVISSTNTLTINAFTLGGAISAATNNINNVGTLDFGTNNLSITGSTITTSGGNSNITLTPNGTGDIYLSSDDQTGVFIGSATTPAPLSISGGIGGNAALVVNQENSGDILTASSSGVTRFTVSNTGQATSVDSFRLLENGGGADYGTIDLAAIT